MKQFYLSVFCVFIFFFNYACVSFHMPTAAVAFQRQALTAHVLSRRSQWSSLHMAASGGKGKSGGGGTALDTRVKQEVKTSIKDEIERDYRLILHDDTVHTIQQVCEILGKVVHHIPDWCL